MLLAGLGLAVAGCGNDGPTGPGAPIGGVWSYFNTFGNSQFQLTCTTAGTLDVVQSDAQFTASADQTGSCTGPGGFVDNSGTHTISGRVSLTSIEFSVSGCNHKGDLFGSPADSAAGTVECVIRDGIRTLRLTGTWFAVKGIDFDSPRVAATVTYPQGDTLFVPGDMFTLALTASDDRKVLWAGYRLGPPANGGDSVRVASREHSGTLSMSVPASWSGASTLTIFARDALNRVFEVPAGTLRVIDAVRRPTQTVPLGGMYTIATDIVYDAKRDVLYLLEGEAGRIAVLSLGSFTFGSPLPLPGPLSGSRRAEMDITRGGDSLIVPIAYTSIGFINLVTGATSTAPIVSDVGTTQHIAETSALANDKALVFGSWSAGGTGGEALWEYDLTSGAHRRRTDIGIGGNILSEERVRSGDFRRLLLLDFARACGQIYEAASNTFSSCKSLPFSRPNTPTSTMTGNRWLVSNVLLDADLNVLATLPGQGLLRGTISTDGSAAYYPTEYGYVKLRLPDGAVIERVRVPVRPTRITALPDGERIVIWTDPGATSELLTTNRVTVVDLQ